MSYLVLARKWRPQNFESVIGQEHVTRTLKNALLSDRLAQGFLFAGTRGVGKTSVARILAKAINCLGPIDNAPCNECESCLEIDENRSVDILEIDGASNNGVEQVRELRENARYLPARAKRKIYIIDEVHMLSKGAFNALLKTLEEPPAHVVFVFATTEVHKVPATILSRCQRYDFRPISPGQIADHLLSISNTEDFELTESASTVLARAAKGSMRDSLSLLDQTISFAGTNIEEKDVLDVLGMVDPGLVWKLAGAIINGNSKEAIQRIEEIANHGHDWRQVYSDLMSHFRNLIMLKTDPDSMQERLGLGKSELAELIDQAQSASSETLQLSLQGFLDSEHLLRTTNQPRFSFELAVLKICQLTPVTSLGQIIIKLDELASTVPAEIDSQLEQNSSSAEYIADISDSKKIIAPSKDENHSSVVNNDYDNAIDYDIHELKKKWPEFVGSIKNPILKEFLGRVELIKVNNETITVESASSFSLLDDSGRIQEIKKLLLDYFGVQYSLVLDNTKKNINKNKSLNESEELRREALNSTMVNTVVDLFGGQEVKISPIEKE